MSAKFNHFLKWQQKCCRRLSVHLGEDEREEAEEDVCVVNCADRSLLIVRSFVVKNVDVLRVRNHMSKNNCTSNNFEIKQSKCFDHSCAKRKSFYLSRCQFSTSGKCFTLWKTTLEKRRRSFPNSKCLNYNISFVRACCVASLLPTF